MDPFAPPLVQLRVCVVCFVFWVWSRSFAQRLVLNAPQTKNKTKTRLKVKSQNQVARGTGGGEVAGTAEQGHEPRRLDARMSTDKKGRALQPDSSCLDVTKP